jgi:hypothetical protein
MWIPLVLLRTAPVRERCRRCQFMARRHSRNRRLFAPVAPAGLSLPLPGLRQSGCRNRRRGTRALVDGIRPAFVDYDTGAALHARLTTNAPTGSNAGRALGRRPSLPV